MVGSAHPTASRRKVINNFLILCYNYRMVFNAAAGFSLRVSLFFTENRKQKTENRKL